MNIIINEYEEENMRKNVSKKAFNNLIEKIDNLIIKTYGCYDTSDLQDIVVALVNNHIFSSKDSIQELIYELENIQENY